VPELPEVEIAREQLERWLAGRRIRDARVPDVLLRGGQSRRLVEATLRGATVLGVSRRGKFLLFDLGRRRPMVLAHLGMTGSFRLLAPKEIPPKFVRAEMVLSRGERLIFRNVRRLGQFRIVNERERRRLDRLGIEPLGPELTASRLFELTRASRRPVKVFLMDQHRIAGIGNIQASEALFRARIHPARAANTLTRIETRRLARAIPTSLRTEIERSRAVLRYLHDGGDNHFLVYGHAGEPCPRCKVPIERFAQGGRSSYYCPSCQKTTVGRRTR
jgi:formamidopyrimidine-DNA glycosylase